MQRLRNEWRALGRLEHPNIVSVTDAGVTATGLPFFVMERLHGETLGARLKRERAIAPAEALSIALQVLSALSAAHRIGVVHRDIKPPNLFLIANGVVKLLDFGIAKVLDPKASQITGRGITLGTPRYMAPEQASGETVDGRTDLYALGLILFEMLAGRGPFEEAREPNELFLAHLVKPPPKLGALAPFVSRELEELVDCLLEKKPALRPPSAEAAAQALRFIAQTLAARGSVQPNVDGDTTPGGPFDTLEREHGRERSRGTGRDPRAGRRPRRAHHRARLR